MATTSQVLDQIPGWPEIAAVDGGGIVDQLRLYADGARTGHPELFRDRSDAACGSGEAR